MLGLGVVGTIIVILVIVWLVRRAWSGFLSTARTFTRNPDLP